MEITQNWNEEMKAINIELIAQELRLLVMPFDSNETRPIVILPFHSAFA